MPAGPRVAREVSADRLRRARLGEFIVTDEDIVIADDDGVVVVAAADARRSSRRRSRSSGRSVARRMRSEAGRSLRDQLRFHDYLERRATDPSLDFRRFLAEIGGAIET